MKNMRTKPKQFGKNANSDEKLKIIDLHEHFKDLYGSNENDQYNNRRQNYENTHVLDDELDKKIT